MFCSTTPLRTSSGFEFLILCPRPPVSGIWRQCHKRGYFGTLFQGLYSCMSYNLCWNRAVLASRGQSSGILFRMKPRSCLTSCLSSCQVVERPRRSGSVTCCGPGHAGSLDERVIPHSKWAPCPKVYANGPITVSQYYISCLV